MFSRAEKQRIAAKVEELLLSLNHPEMPNERPIFMLHVNGVEGWSWADIEPNWRYAEQESDVNPWNEIARGVLANREPRP